MSKNFKQLKGKFGRVTGYPFDPKQDPFRSDPTGNETYVTGICDCDDSAWLHISPY